MTTLTVHQAVLSDLEELAVLFNQYREFQGKASDLPQALYEVPGWSRDRQFPMYHRYPGGPGEA